MPYPLAAVRGRNLTSAPPATAYYRYVSTAHAGAENGLDWANAWDFASIDWAALEVLALTLPVYLFLDQGTYGTQLAPAGSGSSDTKRIFIMPGYAANAMGVPGVHAGHTGAVIIDMADAADPGIRMNGRSYITVSGYTDPRPHVGNDIHFTVRDTDTALEGQIAVIGASTYCQFKRLEITQTTADHSGEGIHLNKGAAPAGVGGHIVEECYIHDLGYWNVADAICYAGTWINYYNNCVVRYCEFYNVGWGDVAAHKVGEGVGATFGNQTGCNVHGNTFRQVGVAVRSIGQIRHNTIYSCENGIYLNGTLGENVYIENNALSEWNAGVANSIVVLAGGLGDTINLNANVLTDSVQCDADIHGTYYATLAALEAEADAKLTISSVNMPGDNGYWTDPANGDFTLTDWAARMYGHAYTVNWTPTRDFAGNALYGATWDVGACERQAVLLTPAGVANLLMWMEAQDLALADLADVTAWNDKSGNLHHWTQPGAAGLCPHFHTNERNGKPAIKFDGADDYMTIADFVASLTNFSVLVVVQPAAAAATDTVLGQWDGGAHAHRCWYIHQPGAGTMAAGVNLDGGAVNYKSYSKAVTTPAWQSFAFTFENNTLNIFTNGALLVPVKDVDAAVASLYDSNAAWMLGCRTAADIPAEWWAGWMVAIVVYNATLSAPTLLKLHHLLAEYYWT